MENPGYRSGSFDGLHRPSSDDDDDEMVDIAGATLDFSSTDDVPPLSSGKKLLVQPQEVQMRFSMWVCLLPAAQSLFGIILLY